MEFRSFCGVFWSTHFNKYVDISTILSECSIDNYSKGKSLLGVVWLCRFDLLLNVFVWLSDILSRKSDSAMCVFRNF